MLRLSIISSLIILLFLLSSCGSDNKATEIENAIISENTKTVAEVKEERKVIRKKIRDLLSYLQAEKLSDPINMYKENKIKKAKEEIKTAATFTLLQSPTADSADYFETQKLNRIRDYYRKGDHESAFIQASNLLKNQTLTPTVRAELLFIMADLSDKNNLKEEGLKFMDMTYQQMKKIPEERDIQDQVLSQKELLETFSEINNIELYEDEEETDSE